MEQIKLFVLAKGFAMLTTKEAAELLDITPRRVQELIKNGARLLVYGSSTKTASTHDSAP